MKQNIIIELEAENISVIEAFCEEIENFLRKNVHGVLIKNAKVIRNYKKKKNITNEPPKPKRRHDFLSLEGTKRD